MQPLVTLNHVLFHPGLLKEKDPVTIILQVLMMWSTHFRFFMTKIYWTTRSFLFHWAPARSVWRRRRCTLGPTTRLQQEEATTWDRVYLARHRKWCTFQLSSWWPLGETLIFPGIYIIVDPCPNKHLWAILQNKSRVFTHKLLCRWSHAWKATCCKLHHSLPYPYWCMYTYGYGPKKGYQSTHKTYLGVSIIIYDP